MVSSTESAITSRDTSDDFMPWWPHGDTIGHCVIVQNSRAVPWAAATPFLTAWAWRISAMFAGGCLVPAGGHAHEGLAHLIAGQTHRIIVGPVEAHAPAPRSHDVRAAWSCRIRARPSISSQKSVACLGLLLQPLAVKELAVTGLPRFLHQRQEDFNSHGSGDPERSPPPLILKS